VTEKPFKLMQARDAAERMVSARQIGLEPEPFTRPLRCPYCEHPVHTQRAYPKTSKLGKPFTVSAHFALARHKDGRPAEHDPGCALRTDHTITTIARESQGFAEVKRGQLQLRLVLAASTDPPAPAAPAPGAPADEPPQEPVNRRIRSTGPPLPPVITSAARIAQLLALYEHDPELLARFTVKHPDLRTPVPWADFCFGPDPASLARLYRKLTWSSSRYPVAVHGRVLDHGVRGGYAFCLIAQDVATGRAAPRDRAPVYLRSPFPGLMAPLTTGMHVLGLGTHDTRWQTWTPKPEGSSPQMRLWVWAHWQIAYWEIGDTGLPTAPKCPPPVHSTAPTVQRHPIAQATVDPSVASPNGAPSEAASPVLRPLHDVPELRGIVIPPMPTHNPDIPPDADPITR